MGFLDLKGFKRKLFQTALEAEGAELFLDGSGGFLLAFGSGFPDIIKFSDKIKLTFSVNFFKIHGKPPK